MASAANFYTCGRIMETIQADSATSEATGYPIENALDFNLDRDWRPTDATDQVIVLDLNNDLQESIILVLDRDFNTAVGTHWSQQTMNGFVIALGDLNISATATGQFCQLDAAGFGGFVAGRTYRIEYDYNESVAGFRFQTTSAQQVIGTCVDGTNETLDFTCDEDATTLVIYALTDTADGEFDNISIRDVTDEDDFEVDGFAIFIRNYQTHFGTSAGLKVEWSDDASTWIEFADKLIESEMNNSLGDPVRIYIAGSSQARRYWRFTFHDMNEVIQVGQLFLVKTRAVAIGNVWPEKDTDKFLNKYTARRGAVPFTIQGNRRPVRNIPRQWRFITQTPMDAVVAALNDSFGSVRPVIFNEGTDFRVVKFLQDDVAPNQVAHQHFSPRIILQELPYIEAGKVF